MYRKFKIVLCFFMTIILIFSSCTAHSGRTDRYGGHKDNRNVSGLGSYHYHCGGYPAHLHENGVCPYTNSTSNVKNNSQNSSRSVNTTNSYTTNNSVQEPVNIPVESIKLNQSSITVELGSQIKPEFTINPSNATDKAVKYSTNNSDVIVINEDGSIKANKVGKADYTVTTNNGKTATLSVDVECYPESIKITNTEAKEYKIGDVIELKTEIIPSNSTRSITWSSSDEKIATVSITGKVTFYSKGTVKISIKDVRGKGDSVEFNVVEKKNENKIENNNEKNTFKGWIIFFSIMIGIGAVIPFVLRVIQKKKLYK